MDCTFFNNHIVDQNILNLLAMGIIVTVQGQYFYGDVFSHYLKFAKLLPNGHLVALFARDQISERVAWTGG